MAFSRREFSRLALSGVSLSRAGNSLNLFAASRSDSRFSGVQVGVIIPYSYHDMPADARSLLDDMAQNGIYACEMQCPPAEQFAGAPQDAAGLNQWRATASMAKFVELRKLYGDAGVWIYGFKLQLEHTMADPVFDYTFLAAKALGANQVTMELSEDTQLTERIGKFAAKHKMMVGYHAHTQATPTLWDAAMAQSAYNGINLDIGHYTSAGNHDVIAFIQKNHARITSVHLKDRKFPEQGGKNTSWGQGDTPIKEVLLLMKREKYRFPATIELEYPAPAGSDSEKEIARCLAYAKSALA